MEDGSVDVVIEVCGNAQALNEGYRLLRPRGFYYLTGLVHPDSKIPFTAEDVIRKCLTIKGTSVRHNTVGIQHQTSIPSERIYPSKNMAAALTEVHVPSTN